VKQIKNLINWFKRYFTTRYTVHVSFDSQWGNDDDQVWHGVRKIIKCNFKELKFRTEDKRTVHIRGMSGLRYRIEDE
tara:strand:+ start:2261 stop:2491 length:231 start_codon:yes stop_codon:yes gene_type:complete